MLWRVRRPRVAEPRLCGNVVLNRAGSRTPPTNLQWEVHPTISTGGVTRGFRMKRGRYTIRASWTPRGGKKSIDDLEFLVAAHHQNPVSVPADRITELIADPSTISTLAFHHGEWHRRG